MIVTRELQVLWEVKRGCRCISAGCPDVRGMSIVLKGQFGKFLGVEKGALLANYTTPPW